MPCAKRFILLYSFLKRNLSKKVMVFFSSCNSVKFHSELLRYIQIPCFDIHGKQKQQKRTTTFFEFCEAEKGILLCTDVAARGLDIPAVVCSLSLSLSLYLSLSKLPGLYDGYNFLNLRSPAIEKLLKKIC